MFAILPPTPNTNNPFTIPTDTMPHDFTRHHRPTISSPLSSPPAVNSRDFSFGHHQRETQSSPLAPSTNTNNTNNANNKLFRFSSTPFRAGNPLTSKKRDEVRDTKRRLFLANVRQRQEDKKWERRGGEDEALKMEFYRLDRERKERMFQQLVVEPEEEELFEDTMMEGGEDDAKMVDLLEEQEREEVDALLELEMERARQEARVGGEFGVREEEDDDGDDYDGLFMEMISSQQGTATTGWDGQDVEMS
ncbi:hypothetical protein QBC44DRAFT_377491 [Cladorrhinum sp. PSN332]|nr:hypothetical protein QBC44DRAFT_377491 [Cladorrhinum sp. PSN332]